MSGQGEPATIGRYEVLTRIGRGAMGTVYRAHDPQIGRTIAIKVLLFDDDDLRARFQQEVRTAGTLTHQNIVAIHDYGEANGRPFIVMEYVEGRTLADLLRDRVPLTLAYKLRLMQQLCAALNYAHARGVIHRDIKPANLMLDAHGDLKVVDFGIAKMGDGQLTRTGDVLGTLAYMSPEQIDGGVVDRRSDIFSVGVVLYELMSSRRAFQGETSSRVIRAILHEQPAALTELCPGLDPALDRIVKTAMQKDPSERYQTLEHVAADLARISPTAEPDAIADAPTGTLLINRSARTNTVDEIVPPAPSASPEPPPQRESFRELWAWIAAVAAVCLVAIGGAAWLTMNLMTKPNGGDVAANPPKPVPIAPVTTIASVPAATTPPVSPATTPATTSPVPAPPRVEGPKPKAVTDPVQPVVKLKPPPKPTLTPYEEAKALLSANATPEDQVKAAGLLRAACDGGENRGCLEAGFIYRDNSTVRNLPLAVQMFQRACDAGTPQGCTSLGVEYARGVGVAKDEVKAASLYRRACEAGGPPACDNLGRAYQQGRGVARDEAEARVWYQKSCDGGGAGGCVDLGVLLVRGIGGPADEARAVGLFQRSCDGGNFVGCANLGLAYARGTVVPRDDARAVSLYQRACDAGGAPSCANLAFMYTIGRGVTKDLAHAAALLERSCDGNNAEACETLSQRFDQGAGVERNPARAAEFLRRANRLRGDQSADVGATTPGTTARVGSPGAVGGVIGGVVGGPLATPAPPPPPPSVPVRVGGTIKAPVKTKHVNPVYSPVARASRIQGVVILEAVIGPDGHVVSAKVLRSIPLLDQAALDAVKQWEFTPTIVNNVAVPVIMNVTVSFSLQ